MSEHDDTQQADEVETADETAGDEGHPTRDGDDVLAEARDRQHRDKELSGLHVRALEHPDEFEGKQVHVPDADLEES